MAASVRPTLAGNQPRPESLIRATWSHDKNLSSLEELRSAQRSAAQHVVSLQRSLGCPDTIDGLFTHQDLMRPIAEATHGIEVGGLVRFHETNTFLRRPILSERFDASDFDAASFLEHTMFETMAGQPVPKVILPTPGFLLHYAEDGAFADSDAAAIALAAVVHAAASAAVDAGAQAIEFNDPTALRLDDDEFDRSLKALRQVLAGLRVPTTFFAYAGDAAPRWAALTDLPVQTLGVDVLETDLDGLTPMHGMGLMAGVLDSRNSQVEPAEVLAAILQEGGRLSPDSELLATHVYDLEFVPPDIAEAKLRSLSQACGGLEVTT